MFQHNQDNWAIRVWYVVQKFGTTSWTWIF